MDSASAKQLLKYFDLPPEIRLRILEFTQLNPVAAPLVPAFRYVPIWKGCSGIPKDWRKESMPSCSICAKNTSSHSYCLQKRFGYSWTFTWSSMYGCRSIPFNLFIVNKQMKAEAEYTLFKFNGFEFFPTRALDVVRYLGGLTEYKLRLLQDLRFTFGNHQCEHWNESGRNDWRLLLNWIKYNENLKDLCLVIDVESHFVYPDCIWPHDETRAEDDAAYIDLYEMVCEMLWRLWLYVRSSAVCT